MADDHDLDRPITFNDAAKLLPTARRPCYSTWWRWWRRGVKGVKLRTLVIGGRRYTTPRFLRDWIASLSHLQSAEAPAPRSPGQREREIRRAERELEADKRALAELA